MPPIADAPMKVDTSNTDRRDLQALARLGYGATEFDVALYLIRRELDDLRRSGVIGGDTP